jgi:hypothetical protein
MMMMMMVLVFIPNVVESVRSSVSGDQDSNALDGIGTFSFFGFGKKTFFFVVWI